MRAMEKKGALALALLLGWWWWSGCSDVRDATLPTEPVSNQPAAAAKVHGEGWADLNTGQFLHAQELEDRYKGSTTFCQRCHGEDYRANFDLRGEMVDPQGNADPRLNCFRCHADPAKGVIHPAGWADLKTGQFLHAQELAKNQDNTATCQGCHGADYTGGIAKVSCLSCHADPARGVIHPAGWADLSTGQFLHAQAIKDKYQGSTTFCQGCHGADYTGGIAKISCLNCHADPARGLIHPDGWLNPAAKETFHGEALRIRNFDMSGCRTCHGADYAGGIVQTSCLTCHAGTPEGCTTCHGSSENLAPPKDTRGNRETSFSGVGAHQSHFQSNLTAALNCIDCHQFPQGFADPAHIDGDGRAELTFGARASANGSAPIYDPQANTCAGTYCHGGGRMGNQAVPVWTEVGTGQAACGTCHSLPPGEATGHPQVALSCSICHGQVVDADNNIVDPSLHLNGQTDF